MKKKTNEEKEKKSESTGLTRDPFHESLIIKQKKLILRNYRKKIKESAFSLWTAWCSP
jgi:hypothetical protein